MPSHNAWCTARRILAVRLDNLGDLLMTTPALAALRHAPDVQITLLGGPAAAAALPHLPMVHDAVVYDAPWMKGAPDAERSADADRALIDRLAAGRYDAAVVFTVATQSALPAAMLCRLAGIPLRLAHSRENPYDLLTHWVAETDVVADGMRHEVTRQTDLVASLGLRASALGDTAALPSIGRGGRLAARFDAADAHGSRADAGKLRFDVGGSDTSGVADKLRAAGATASQRYIVVHPGATAASRRYPTERYALAADALAARTGRLVVWGGSAEEGREIDEARAAMRHPGVSLAGQLTLGELGALIAGADVLLCNNSAPAHLAAAVGTPVVVLYALTNPQHTPWQVPSRVLSHDVPCRNCLKSVCPQRHHRCLLGVPVDSVVEAAVALMQTTPPHRSGSLAALAMHPTQPHCNASTLRAAPVPSLSTFSPVSP